ncbi:alpha/beta hydrolase fold domain-containing protein [Reichenbachiella sp.]|uniref:alpha/beta hydrolase fold domain-containing protein n=1 Tax=Reichenbachiella sp. TaxID=2184521 RepID=UPI003BAE9537
MKNIKNLLLTAGLIKIWCGLAVSLYAQEVVYAPVNVPKGYTKNIDLIYKELDGWKGRLDLYFPLDTTESHPLVINIHGGGWNHGVKESQRGFSQFFEKNFVVANVEYRLESVAKAPAAIEDVRCALIYLINNASRYRIDQNRVIMMGASAGGHLALMAGLLNDDRSFDNGCSCEKKIEILAIVDKYGVADLEPFCQAPSVKKWLGTRVNDLDFVRSVSPINYIDSSSPDVFIVHGKKDPTVPYTQSKQLHEMLQRAGAQSEFVTIENGSHGKFSKEENDKFNEALLSFFEKLGL